MTSALTASLPCAFPVSRCRAYFLETTSNAVHSTVMFIAPNESRTGNAQSQWRLTVSVE